MGYEVSAKTVRRIKSLLARGGGTGTPAVTGGGTARYEAYVTVTGPQDGDYFPCVVVEFDAEAETWTPLEQECLAFGINDEPLVEDQRYSGRCVGVVDDQLVFCCVAGAAWPDCYFTEDSDGTTHLDLDALLGDGLEVHDESSNDCPPIRVKAGCHIDVDPDGVHVTPDTLAGDGLEVQDNSGCDSISVKPGCGVRITEDGAVGLDLEAIAFDGLYGDNELCTIGVNVECGLQYVGTSGIGVDHEALAGPGLEVDDNSSGCDSLKVKTGCGVRLDGNNAVGLDLEAVCTEAIKGVNDDGTGCSISLRYGCHLDLGPDPLEEGAEAVFVTVGTLAGDGLEVQDDSSSGGCDKIKVKTGCGLVIDEAGAVAVDATELAGPTFSCITSISPNGCGLTYNVTPFTFSVNECGVFLGFEAGEPVAHHLSLTACCDCSDESSSDESSSDDSSSSSSDECTGWYYCPATGVVAYYADCEAVAADECELVGPYEDDPRDECTGWFCCEDTETVVFLVNCAAVAGYECGEGDTIPVEGCECTGDSASQMFCFTLSTIEDHLETTCDNLNTDIRLGYGFAGDCTWSNESIGVFGCWSGCVYLYYSEANMRWELSFASGGLAVYYSEDFDCVTGGTFILDTYYDLACTGWPETIEVAACAPNGTSCIESLGTALDTVASGSDTGSDKWYRFGPLTAGSYSFNVTDVDMGNPLQTWKGNNCGGKTSDVQATTTGCQTITASEGDYIWVQMITTGGGGSGETFEFTISEGAC